MLDTSIVELPPLPPLQTPPSARWSMLCSMFPIVKWLCFVLHSLLFEKWDFFIGIFIHYRLRLIVWRKKYDFLFNRRYDIFYIFYIWLIGNISKIFYIKKIFLYEFNWFIDDKSFFDLTFVEILQKMIISISVKRNKS